MTPHRREVAALPDGPTKRIHLLDCYRRALSTAGFRYLLDFELVDRRGQSLYLVFGTSHERGVEKMKDSLWEVDRSFGIGFRDPRNDQSEGLFNLEEPQLAPFGRLLLPEIAKHGDRGCQVKELIKFTTFETVFRRQHIIRTLAQLRDEGKVETPRLWSVKSRPQGLTCTYGAMSSYSLYHATEDWLALPLSGTPSNKKPQ